MPSFAITGAIGSGKSKLLHLLGELLKAQTYSADQENAKLLDEDIEVKALICSHFGASCYHHDRADRAFLASLIQRDPSARASLESILHPRLEKVWKPLAETFRTEKSSYFLAEIPLLYEKQLDPFFDKVLVVGCSDSVRRERLIRSRSMTDADFSAWVKMQALQSSKVTKADYALWNDGSEEQYRLQIERLSSYFLQK